MIDEHIEQVAELASPLPYDAVWLLRQYRLARTAIEASGLDLTACFNDPIAMNFMLAPTAESMLLVDYEYASNNDRCYDLGVWFGEMFFSERVEIELIERYFGRVEPHIFARVQLHKALADIKWGYWSLVQMKQSTLAFDYAKYGAGKFLRARSIMQDWRWLNRPGIAGGSTVSTVGASGNPGAVHHCVWQVYIPKPNPAGAGRLSLIAT